MKRLSIKQMVLAAALAVGTALTAVAADPITYTWTGASGDNANWSNPANWDQNNGKVPGTADWAIIPASEDGQPWQITIDKTPSKPADFYVAGPTVFSGGFTLNAQVNGASGHGGVLSQGKMEVTGEKTAASLSGVTKTAPMKLASDASYLASEGGSITFGYLCFDNSKDISFVASNQNSKVTLSTMWTNAAGTAQPNLNENNTGLFFGAYDGGLLTLSPAMKFVTGNDPTFIADGGSIVAKSTQATTADAVLYVTSTNGGSVTFGALTGSPVVTSADNGTVIFGAVTGALTADCTGASRVIFAGGTGNPTINCEGAGSVVTNTGTLTGNATVTAKDGAFVKLNTVIGDAKIDSSNGGNVYYTWKTKGNADVTCAGEGSGVTNTANMTGNVVAKATEKGFVKYGNVSGSFDLTADGEGTAMVFGSVGKAGLDSSLKVSDKAKVTTGATSGSVTLVADKGATAELTSTMATGTHSMTATDEGTLVWVKGAITGDTTIDASNMATVQVVNASAAAQGITGAATMTAENGGWIKTGKVTKNVSLKADGAGSFIDIASTAGAAGTSSFVTATNNGVVQVESTITGAAVTLAASEKGTIKLVNAAGTTYQKITGATTITCTDEGSAVQLAGFGVAGQNSSITATDNGAVLAGASLGNVSIAADKGAEVKLTSTMGTGNHTIACSNEDSVVWIQNTVTGNPVITCEDKGTVKLMKADNVSLIGVSGYPTVMCSGEGSSVTMGNLGATAAGVNVLKAKDGATVTVGTTKFTIQAEASNGALLKMGSMTPSADNNEIVADNATIQFTGAMNGNKSFTSVYEVKGADGLIEGIKAGLLFGSDAKTTVKLMPLRSRSSAFIKTTTSGDLTFGAGVNYVADLSDVSQDTFYGDKKFLIAQSAGKLTFNAPTSVTVTGVEPEYYSASLAAEGTKLYLTITCTKVPEGKVAVVGIDEFYETLGEAVGNVKNGGLIGVMTDVAVAEKIANPEGKTVTLNLNGNTLTSELTDCVIDNAGTLVLKGAGAIESTTAGVLIINRPTGVLTVEDGTYTCAKVLENQAQGEAVGTVTIATAVFNGASENGGMLSVAAGTFGEIANNGELTITAGTYGALVNNGVLSISGGAFSGNEYALYNCCTATVSSGTFDGIVACDGEVGALEITGGTFMSEVEEKSDGAEIVIAGEVGTSLNTATFAFDETDYCEEGYVTFKSDDVYIVRRATDVVITPVNANEELGTLTVENAGTQISELGVTLRGTITNVKTGFVPVILIGGQRVNVAQDGSFEGPAVESAEVVAAYAKASAWYLDPFCRNTIDTNMQSGNSSPIGSTFDENEGVLAINGDPGVDRCGVAHYDAQAFRASVNPNFPRIKWDKNVTGLTYSYRQLSVSVVHQAVFGCPWYTTGKQVPVSEFDSGSVNYSVPFDLSELVLPEGVADPTDSFLWNAALGDAVYYRNDSTYDYFKFAVMKDDAGKVTSLKAEKYVGTVPGAPRAKMINDVPYLFSHSGVRFLAMNLNDGSVITNIVTMPAGTYGSTRRVYVTGVADGTPHLVVHDENVIGVWALTADALHVVSPTPIASFNTAEYFGSASNAGFASSVAYDDELNFVFVRRNLTSYVFEHKPAKLIVRGTFSDEANAEEDALVDFGGAVEKTYSAPKDYMITAVKVNGVADSNFTDASYTYRNAALDTHVYIAMTIEKRPVAQIGSAKYTELDAAFAAAKAGDTVTLLRDAEVGPTLRNESAITLDLGGFSLTRADGATGTMLVAGADLTVTNGTINGGAKAILNIDSGNVVLGDNLYVTDAGSYFLEVYNGVLTIGAGCVVEAKGCILDAESASVVNIYGTMRCSGESPLIWVGCTELNVYEGADLTSAGDIFRSNADATELNVYGGRMKSGGYPVFYCYSASRAVITIADGEISANANTGLFQMNCATASVKPLTDDCKAKFSSDIKHTFVGGVALADLCATGFAPVKGEDGYYTIQKLYDITIAAAENGTVETSVTNGVVVGTEVTITATPAETYAVDKVYTNDVELAAVDEVYSFLMPAENVEVKATFKATAKPPCEPIPSEDPAGDAAKMNGEDGTVKPELINAPFDMDAEAKADYAAFFTAVPGAGVVTIELNEAGTNAVEAAEQVAGTAALDAVLGADGDSAELNVAQPLVGFFYSLKQSAAVDSLGYKADTDKNKLGGRDTISFGLDKSEASGFYQMIVSPMPVK